MFHCSATLRKHLHFYVFCEIAPNMQLHILVLFVLTINKDSLLHKFTPDMQKKSTFQCRPLYALSGWGHDNLFVKNGHFLCQMELNGKELIGCHIYCP